LFVITSMPVGGAETLLVNMMRQFDPTVVKAEIACLKEAGPLGEQIAGEFSVHANLIRGKFDLWVLYRLIRLIRDNDIDAVITIGAGDKMFWGRVAAAWAGVPFIASALHSTGWPDGVGRLNRLLTGITDAFIAVADSHGQFLREFEKFPAAKVRVIRNGVDCQRFRPNRLAKANLCRELQLPASVHLVGIVAALRPEKNHAMLVQASSRLRQSCPNARWIVVGDGPERDALERLADQLSVADRIHFLGTRHDTAEILASLDLFTLCSLNEASPVSILEALACQVPVVATDVGSVGETVMAGKTGTLVASEDVDGYVTAVKALLDCPETRDRFGRAGRQLVLETGSLSSMVAGYQRLITEGCAGTGGARAELALLRDVVTPE